MSKRLKRSTISPEDLKDFEAAMTGVKPLKNIERVNLSKPVPTQRRKREPDEETPNFNFTESEYFPSVGPEDAINHAKSGLSNKILRKLSKGQYTIDARLDLHGMTVAKARETVTEFIGFHHQQGARVLLIIHGKGYQGRAPKLKNALNQWLRQAAPVLAFCSAMPGDGNRGAVYVLLSSRGD